MINLEPLHLIDHGNTTFYAFPVSQDVFGMPGLIPYHCAAGVAPALMAQVVRVESSGNPYAIGVVGGHLQRQPATLAEAVATVRSLEQKRYNYSIGMGQVNRVHFDRLGWKESVEQGFDPCANLRASAGILQKCYDGAVKAGYAGTGFTGDNQASRASLSCYYSGNYRTGERLGYVNKVLGADAIPDADPDAIPVIAERTSATRQPRAQRGSGPGRTAGIAAKSGGNTFPSMFD